MLRIKVEVRPSPIHGLGVFSLEPVEAGMVIWERDPLFDITIDDAILAGFGPVVEAEIIKYCYVEQGTGETVLCADSARYMNHSDDPNVGPHPSRERTEVARRNIIPGEELTCDYRHLIGHFTAYSEDGSRLLGHDEVI